MRVSSKPDVAELAAIRQEAMDFAGIGLYRYTFEGVVQFMDRGAMRILGIETRFTSPEALVGLDISDLIIYTAPKGFLRERIREERHVRGLEYRFRTLDGDERWVEHDSYLVEDTETGVGQIQAIIKDITSRKRAEEAIRESEERFRSLFENAPLGYQSLDANGDFIELNETWCKLLGYSKEEVLGKNFSEFIHPDFRDVFKENFPKFKSMGYILGVEFEMIKKDGSTIVVAFDGKIALKEDGSFKQTHCVFSDVTERKCAVEALINERLLSEEYINSMPGLFYVFDEERFVRWNSEWEKATGYSGEELATMYGPDFFIGEDRKLIEKRMRMVFTEGAAEAEADLVTKDGHRIPYFFTGFQKEIDGKPHLVGLGIDITRRRRAEKALQESEATFSSIVESSPMGIYTYQLEDDDRLVLIGANPAASSLTGVDNSPFIGKTIEEAFPPLADTEIPDRYRRAAGHGENWFTEQVNYDHGGISGAFEVYAFQMSPGKAAVLFNNITDRKRAEEALDVYRGHLEELVERRTRQLKEAQEALIQEERLAALGKVTAMVSHELRNPLGTVRTSVFSIGEAIKKDDIERVSRALVLAERNIVRCDNIIDELLDFSRTRELKSEETDIEDWLARLLDEGVVPGEIACAREFGSGCKVPIDRERMRRVVINVLTNAVHAMQEDGANGNRLTVSTRVLDGRLEICFNDTGSGFSDEDLSRLFEPMFSTKDFGVGLGLPIVRGIMRQHGGDIEIRNNADKGATVTLWLPLSTPEEA